MNFIPFFFVLYFDYYTETDSKILLTIFSSFPCKRESRFKLLWRFSLSCFRVALAKQSARMTTIEA